MADTRVAMLRAAFERHIAGDEKAAVQDADVQRNGNAYEGGFSLYVEGTAARAEMHVGRFTAHVMFYEYGAGQSLHPVPGLAGDGEIDHADADRMVAQALQQVWRHVNRSR